MKYLPRIIDGILDDYLEAFGAVLLTGPKWCGKTTSASQKAKSILKLQDPDTSIGYLKTAEIKPSLLLKGENPRLIDEWQMAPVLWDSVRNHIDDSGKNGLFILTGSTTVEESKIMHSGTGRIARLKMLPMSLSESGESNGSISLHSLMSDKNYDIDGKISELSIESLVFSACRGGWPASLNKNSDKAKLLISRAYVDSIIETDISAIDNIKRDPGKVQRVLRAYARNVGTLATNKTLIDDINSNTSLSESAFYEYVNSLNRLFVIQDIPAWNPSIRSKTAIRSSTKKMFIDPSIMTASLGLSPDVLLQDFHTFGFIFENLCIRDLTSYAMSSGGRISYYNDRSNLEVDAVLHLDDGRYGLIEFKLGSKGIEEGASHLLKVDRLIKKNKKLKSGLGIREPEVLIIITGGEIAYTRPDGVKIVPIGCLKE